MIFNSLEIENWNQFDNINISFHPRLTVLTGANGAGKSTILRMLSRLAGWHQSETATPSKIISGKFVFARKKIAEPQTYHTIGKIKLEKSGYIQLQVPPNITNPNYIINFSSNPHIRGLSIPSHRMPYSYKQINSIPVKAHTKREAFSEYSETFKNAYIGSYVNETPMYKMKSSLISLAVFGKGNTYVTADETALNHFTGFIDILKKLLPDSLKFTSLSVRNGEVILETDTGDFIMDAVSGGIGSILDLAWQIFMFEEGKEEEYFVLIDEAENHLHASMQRSLLPKLIESFPKAQFIVTTHSPLMVNSVKDSNVFALKYNEDNGVSSQPLDFVNKTANASKILREVLGVPITIPIWVENNLQKIVAKYNSETLSAESYLMLKSELEDIGMSENLPQALDMLQEGDIDA